MIYFTCFIFFCRFTLLVCGEKNILANLTNSQELEPVGAGSFWLLGAGAAWQKKTGAGAGAAWEKNQEPEPLEKKLGSRSQKKICRLPSPDFKDGLFWFHVSMNLRLYNYLNSNMNWNEQLSLLSGVLLWGKSWKRCLKGMTAASTTTFWSR